MTAQVTERYDQTGRPGTLRAAASEALLDPVGINLERIAAELDATCLLESPDGRLVGHALAGQPPPCAVTAVLYRDASELHRARRTTSQAEQLETGPVLHTSLEGWTGHVTVVPVARHGWLWLLAPAPLGALDWEEVVLPLRTALDRVRTPATDQELMELLHGVGPAVHAIDSDQRVVAVRPANGAVDPQLLDRVLRDALLGLSAVRCTADAGAAYAIFRTKLHEADLQVRLSAAVLRAGNALGSPLCAAVSPSGLPPAHARRAAAESLAARMKPDHCTTWHEALPHVVLPGLIDQVRQVPTFAGDPLSALDDSFALTVLEWLHHFGEVNEAALCQHLHRNTVRYRVSRAKELMQVDLDDPVVRLVLHLQLLARFSEHPLHV